jgi:hypothetical protein
LIWTPLELLLSDGADFDVVFNPTEVPSFGICKQSIPKKHFATICGDNGEGYNGDQALIDHYQDTRGLMNSLDHKVDALKAFNSRTAGSAHAEYRPGDYTYALMCLFHWRPNINWKVSGFLAFARCGTSCC